MSREDDLREEIDSHLRMARDERIARGTTPNEASAEARRELGNLSQIQEATRDAWGHRWLERAVQDVRYALRVFAGTGALPSSRSCRWHSVSVRTRRSSEMVNAIRLQALPVADPSSLAEIRIVDLDGARGSFQTWHPAVTNPVLGKRSAIGRKHSAECSPGAAIPSTSRMAGRFAWRPDCGSAAACSTCWEYGPRSDAC